MSLSKYRTGYSNMREIVDHFFPPVGLLVKGGGEEFTDFNYWRDKPLDIEDFSASESEDEEDEEDEDEEVEDEDEDGDAEDDEEDEYEDGRSFIGRTPAFTPGILSEDEYAAMGESYFSTDGRPSLDQSVMGESMHSAKDEVDDEGDDDADGDDEPTTSLQLDDQQKDVQRELRQGMVDMAKTLSVSPSDTQEDHQIEG